VKQPKTSDSLWTGAAQRLLERDAPTDDPPFDGVDDEGDIDEAGANRDIGEFGDSQLVRPRRLELPIDFVSRAGRPMSRSAFPTSRRLIKFAA
jgi:hypothetical protein